jgi:putative lipase involved disintegration of autophagic bodies
LTTSAITEALKNGDFYASSGVVIKDITITDKEYKLEITTNQWLNYSTFFIGKDGKILKEDYSSTPSYQFKGDELYVRAKVFCSSGTYAITQPKFLKRK